MKKFSHWTLETRDDISFLKIYCCPRAWDAQQKQQQYSNKLGDCHGFVLFKSVKRTFSRGERKMTTIKYFQPL
jgi:uncharacterized C2H2 Zn-finger protein